MYRNRTEKPQHNSDPYKEARKQLGARLRAYREKNGLTLADVASVFNVHYSTVANWESGKHMNITFVPRIKLYIGEAA